MANPDQLLTYLREAKEHALAEVAEQMINRPVNRGLFHALKAMVEATDPKKPEYHLDTIGMARLRAIAVLRRAEEEGMK